MASDDRLPNGMHKTGVPLRAKACSAGAGILGEPGILLHIFGDGRAVCLWPVILNWPAELIVGPLAATGFQSRFAALKRRNQIRNPLGLVFTDHRIVLKIAPG